MFPYTFPCLIIAWTFLFFMVQDIYTFGTIFKMVILKDIIFLTFFILLAIKTYKQIPKTTSEYAFIISFNLSVLPLLLLNTFNISYIFKPIGSAGIIYMVPMMYGPIIFIISFPIIYFITKTSKQQEIQNSSEQIDKTKVDSH